MTEKNILRYLDLVDRRLKILTSGDYQLNWKPEYEKELESIDKELAQLRPLVDAEYAIRRKRGRWADRM